MAQDRRNSANYYKQIKRVGASRRKVREPIPYNSRPCNHCGKPLGKTLNRFFHFDCHRTVSDQMGIETSVSTSFKRNGSFRST